ncbi:hypothetical protein BDR22DRAFT_817879 [Usnea florida]
MPFFTSANLDKSPVQYLLEGLFPNLARYLAGGSTRGTKKAAQTDLPKDNPESRIEVLPGMSLSTEGSSNPPAEAPSTFEKPLEAESPSGESRLNTTAHLSRSELLASFDVPPVKPSNRRSLPALALPHTRNVSTSSDETLVWSPSGPSSSVSPAISRFDQDLRDAAERVVRKKQADEIRRLKDVITELRREKDDETHRADGLQIDLAVSEANQKKSLNMAIQYYKKQGNPFLVELEALSKRVEEMRDEIQSREDVILGRDETIEALRQDCFFFADRDHWILMQQRFNELQQQYGDMPAEMRSLERRHGDLEDDYADLSSSFRNLEADLTVLRAQLSEVQDERDELEDEASTVEQQFQDAMSRYGVERNEILKQKAESEEQAGARESLLADLASRSFKRTITLSEVETYDDELVSLCHLAQEHLGIDYKDIVMGKARAKSDGETREECDESGVLAAHACDASSATASNSNQQEPNLLAGSNGLESPNTYDARRRREVAAAEEAILGPLGLGFEDGSPTLKTIPKSSKPSRVGIVPTSPETPSKARRGLFALGTDEVDQVTPARTGGTGGIARDQWQIAADDLYELTEVFRGPRVQLVGIVSPEAGIQAAPEEGEGSSRDGSDSHPYSEQEAFFSPNLGDLYEDDSVGEAAVEGPVGSNSENLPLAEGSRVFLGLEMGNENVQQGADAIPDLPKAFNAPSFEDFKFGKGSGAIVFTGTNEPSALTEDIPASAAPGIFNLSSASTQAPMNADTLPFEQNFNFGGSNAAVSFTASQNAPSCLPTSAPESESTAASSVFGTPLAENSPAVTAEANNEVPNEEVSEAIEEDPKAEALANKQKSKKANAKAKKADEKARKAEERKEAALKSKGPNRNQRRAASRERRTAEKKAKAETKKAQSAAAKAVERRRAVTTA